jgi:CHAT domain-containing protein
VEAIAAVAGSEGLRAETLSGAAATPAAVVAALGGAAVAHFATHGFFYGDETTPVAVASRTDLLGAPAGPEADMTRNPLAESGLALAGANAGPAGSLSAEEIVGLDLSGLGLAVLSACETGRGTEVTGQGVLGLQASVLAAGARGLLMSLWKVPDASTALLMEHFYRNLWEAGMAPAAALREAQFSVAADARFAAPVHWAAWVLAGDAF